MQKVIFLFCLLAQFGLAQPNKIDSLKMVINANKGDSNEVKALNALAWDLKGVNLDTASVLSNEAYELARKIKWLRGIIKAKNQLGIFEVNRANYKDCIAHYLLAKSTCEKLIATGNSSDVNYGKQMLAKVLTNLGNSNKELGLLDKALKYAYESLKLGEEAKDDRLIGTAHNTLGNLHRDQQNSQKALEHYLLCLQCGEKINDKEMTKAAYGNCANVYYGRLEYNKAMAYYEKAKQLSIALGDSRTQASMNANLANVYRDMGNYKMSEELYLNAIQVSESLNEYVQRASTLAGLGVLYMKMKKIKEAESVLLQSLSIAKQYSLQNQEQYDEKELSIFYDSSHQPAKALEHYKKFISLRDSMYSVENSKKMMRAEMNYDFEKQQAVEEAKHQGELEKQNAMAEEASSRQNLIIISVLSGLLFVSIFAVFVWRSLRKTRKQKAEIDAKNRETELQKEIIEEKQKEIIDSIQYASRIQRALITSEKYINRKLKELL